MERSPPNAQYPPPKAGEPALHRAARLGDHETIRAEVAAGTPVDELFDIRLDPSAGAQFATPLMVAAGSADGATVDTVRLLLELGASVETEAVAASALTYACHGLGWNYPPGGDAARVALLLDAGADPHRTNRGTPVLAVAARTGDAERVRLLLEAGAVPNGSVGDQRFMCFRLPLHAAAASGSVECVQRLLAAGAPATNDGADHSPLACAASAGVVTELLAAGCDPNGPGQFSDSVVASIAQQDDMPVDERTEMLRRLVDGGADIDARPSICTAVAGAAMRGDADAVASLLAAGADPRIAPNALQFACFSYSSGFDDRIERVVDLLVAAGMDVDDRDHAGYGPLHAALLPDWHGAGYCSSDGVNPAAAAALIRNGASIDIVFPCLHDERPLHVVAGEGVAVEVLLAAGADPRETTHDGKTALELARAALRSRRSRADDPDDQYRDLYRGLAESAARAVRALEAAEGRGPETK